MVALAKKKAGKTPRRPGRNREQYVTLPQGDVGPDTFMQRRNASIRPHYGRGGDWHFKRREPMHEILSRPHGRGRTATLSPRQRNAADDLLDAWEALDKRGEVSWARPFVDGASDRSDAMVGALDAQTHYNLLQAQIPEDCRYAVLMVICRQWRLNEYASEEDDAAQDRLKEQLRRGLGALADFLRY